MKTRSAAKPIKDLKDLRAFCGRAFYRHAGPKGPEEKEETFFTVARGPVPRDLHRPDVCFPTVVCDRLITNRSGAGAPALQSLAHERWRGTGPRPT